MLHSRNPSKESLNPKSHITKMELKMSCKSGARADISTDLEAISESYTHLNRFLFIFGFSVETYKKI
jgi:hypothetical protein